MRIASNLTCLTTVALLGICCGPAFAGGHSIDRTGPHDASVSGSTMQQGNHFSGSGTATGARGNSVSGSYSGSLTAQGATAQGEVTGPKGVERGASATASDGSATVTGSEGKSHTFTSH